MSGENTLLHWEEVPGSRRVLATGYGGRAMVRVTFFNLNTGETLDWDFFEHNDFVHVFALTEVDGVEHVIMVRQFRPGPMDFVIGLPAGTGNTESFKELALEELLEESGYQLVDGFELVYLGEHIENVAFQQTRGHLFFAPRCKKVREPMTEENEDVEVVLVPLEEWIKQMGDAVDVPAFVATYRALTEHLGYRFVKTS